MQPGEMQPGEMYLAMIEYSRPGWAGHRNEQFEYQEEKVTVTRLGAVGEVVEGFVEPIALKEDDTDEEGTLAIRFHVCRAPDFSMRVR
jgi:hypothetical protein